MSKQSSSTQDCCDNQTSDPIVRTESGDVRGRTADGVHVFKGVPFAAPPFGPNYLRPPQAPESWGGVRDALEFGPKSPQVPYPMGIAEGLAELVGAGKDCLTLNVWTPSLGAAGRPVMAWIPGGMFEFHATGAVAYYDGGRFARDGVVCVTISYRVGAQGFLYLADGVPNLGLLDQIAALEWVQKNITVFGGDPGKVTIFGESAGGMSVATLLAVPRAKGLFHRAMVQSGNSPKLNSTATGKRIGQQLAEILGIEGKWEAINATPSDRVLQAQATLRDDLLARPDPAFWDEVALSYLPWAPIIDGDILPEHPIDAIRAGVAADIDLVVGSNTEETRLFLVSDGSIDRITEETLSAIAGAYGLPQEGLDAYRASHPGASAGELFSAIQTDWYWRIPAIRFADAHAKTARASTYMYEFAWRSPQMGGRLGASHALEIAFVFDTLGLGTEPLLGPTPPQDLADAMHRAWVAFATTGDPGWPKYDASRRSTMHFDIDSRAVDDPLDKELKLWDSVH
ncbi:Alpha/Beta hydrolase protein [Fusarium redolens]|uniref:Carboxylic ester hydrolase n=1 Tax=Fusarium redolens TaxID=48865 RepID=A0A9P9JU19_FUSRE|nr:Alpha/Beta hydrolase protein [Fusarium redolens]KAH7232185.1 Alpha/Beta hydrolase protein [Fusarium redolens]